MSSDCPAPTPSTTPLDSSPAMPPLDPSPAMPGSTSDVTPLESPKPSKNTSKKLKRKQKEADRKKKIYKARVIDFFGRRTHIIHQNENGPCSLVAICNVLLLSEKINLGHSNVSEVSEHELLRLIRIHLSSHPMMQWQPADAKDPADANVSKAMKLLSKVKPMLMEQVAQLPTGLYLNVKFRSIDAFEDTPVIRLFQFLEVPLRHGWVINPKDTIASVVAGKSFDELAVEFAKYKSQEGTESISSGSAVVDTPPTEHELGLIDDFLHCWLTPHGLSCLQEGIQEKELFVLFWRSHFTTAIKLNGELYLLQTDMGFLTSQADVVWQRLDKVDGDGVYLTSNFTPSKEQVTVSSVCDNEPFVSEPVLNRCAEIADLELHQIHALYESVGKMILAESDNTKREEYLKRLIAQHESHQIHTFYEWVGQMIVSESDNIKCEEYLKILIEDHEPDQIHTFYESVGQMIQAESDNTKREEYLKRLMSLTNKKWAEIIGEEVQSIDILKDEDVIRSVINILQTNTIVANSLGPYFFPQISLLDMMVVYRMCSKLVSDTITDGGPFALRSPSVELLRSVKRETLKLIGTFLDNAKDLPKLGKQFVLPMMDPVLDDYTRSVPGAREPEVLCLFATIISKYKGKMLEEVPRIFEAVFQCTLEMITKNFEDYPEHCLQLFLLLCAIGTHCFQALIQLSSQQLKLVMDSISWALQHTEMNIADTALSLLLEILKNFEASGFQNQFYKTYFLTIEQETFALLMDTLHKPGFNLHVSVLHHLFNAVDGLTEPLWDASTVPQFNAMFVRDYTIKFLSSSFPNMKPVEVTKFVDGLLTAKTDLPNFKNHIRDFLVRSKELPAQVDGSEAAGIGTEGMQLDDEIGVLSSGTTSTESKLSCPSNSLISFQDFLQLTGNQLVESYQIYCGENAMRVERTTAFGRRAFNSYLHCMTDSHYAGQSWNGMFSLEDFFVSNTNNPQFEICARFFGKCSYEAMKNDYVKFASEMIPLFGEAAFFKDLNEVLRNFLQPKDCSPDMVRRFRLFITAHLALKDSMSRSDLFLDLYRVHQSLGKVAQSVFRSILKGVILHTDWRSLVKQIPILLKVYNYKKRSNKDEDGRGNAQNLEGVDDDGRGNAQNLEGVDDDGRVKGDCGDDIYEAHLFSLMIFTRHATQHITDPSKDDRLKTKKLIEVDLLLSKVLECHLPWILWELIFYPLKNTEIWEMLEEVWQAYDRPEIIDNRPEPRILGFAG